MKELDTLINRLNRLGIKIELTANYPWVYLNKVNGNKVIKKYRSEHGFVIGYLPIRPDQKFTFTELNEIFKIIRKYERTWNNKRGVGSYSNRKSRKSFRYSN